MQRSASASPVRPVPASGFERAPAAAALLFVLGIGLTRLFDPFSGDQALFLVGAKALHAGGVLYRDYWDIKQPGIFAFYYAAGRLFGFTEIGVHALEIVWQLTFCLALVAALRRSLDDPRWAAFAPLAVAGATYAGSSAWHLLQVEELVGLPIFLSLWAAKLARARDARARRLALASGIAAGVVVLFKLVLAPVVLAVVLAMRHRRDSSRSQTDAPRETFWFAWCAGLAIPVAGYLGYAVATGSLGIALETAFVVPFDIARTHAHAPVERLGDTALRLVLYYRGLIALAIIGAFTMRDARTRPWRAACLAWLGSGAGVVLLQAASWWQYHALLLVPPFGVLATFGAAFLGATIARGGRRALPALAAAALVAYVGVPLPQGAIGTAWRVLRDRPFASSAALAAYRASASHEYASARADALPESRFGSPAEAIYVFGNPLLYVVMNRPQAIAMTDWASYLDSTQLWKRADDDLARARPRYIFIDRERRSDVDASRSPRTASALARAYAVVARLPDGTWYARSSGAAPGRLDAAR